MPWEILLNIFWSIVTLVIVAIAVWAVHYTFFLILRRAAKRTSSKLDDSIAKHTRVPVLLILMPAGLIIVIKGVLPTFGLGANIVWLLVRLLSIFMIGAFAWLIIRAVNVLQDYLLDRYRIDVADNLKARTIHTQFRVIKRIVTVIVIIIAVGSILMTFDNVKQLGTSILASAGIIGIVAGLAAQRSLATLFAGMQIALTQPIRIDDVVIVEGEWGRIEEITLTYVVVRIWDLRRLIVPITYFIEKPFQNWTRASADILGYVYFYFDYSIPLDALRAEFKRLLEASDDWNKKVAVVSVTNMSEKTIEVRCLMSANDASLAWNLRCHIREKMIEFVQKNYPQSLPQFRAELNQIKPQTKK